MIYYIQPLTIIGSLKKDYGIESVFQRNKHKKDGNFEEIYQIQAFLWTTTKLQQLDN